MRKRNEDSMVGSIFVHGDTVATLEEVHRDSGTVVTLAGLVLVLRKLNPAPLVDREIDAIMDAIASIEGED